MKKNKGNSGLYGRVTKKQMGGAAKPVGMSGPGFLAGEIPPDGSGKKDLRSIFDIEPSEEDLKRNQAKKNYYESLARNEGPIMRTNDFQDKDMNGVDDRDESSRGKKRPSGTVKTGPGRGPRGPSRDQLQRIQEMIAGKADRGGRNPGTRMPRLPGADRGRPPSGDMDKFRDFIKNANAEGGKDMPRLPGGGMLRPPEMGPNPDAERMGPRRFEGMGASIIEALGIKSGKMGDKSRKEPPRPRTTGGRRGRGRRD
jgi:hypothetical protein